MIRSSYQSLMTPNQSKTSCDQELLSELVDSLIDQQTCYDRELLWELIVTPINKSIESLIDRQNFLHFFRLPDRQTNFSRSGALIRAYWLPWSINKHVMIGSSYQSSLSPRSTNPLNLWLTGKTFCTSLDSLIDRQTSRDQELLSELNDSHSIKNVLQSRALIRAHWLPDRPTNMLWSGALIRAHCHPLPELTQSLRGQHTFCDRKLLSELIDSPIGQKLLAIRSSYQSLSTPLIDQKTCCDRELLSELIVTPINKSIES